MKGNLIIAFVVFTVSLLAGTLYFHGSPEHQILSVSCGFVFVVVAVSFWSQRELNHSPKYAGVMICLCAFFGGAGFSYFSGNLYCMYSVQTTQSRLEAIFVEVEKSRKLDGKYPKQIDELLRLGRLPWLTNNSVKFLSRDDFCWVFFPDPNSGETVYIYDSKDKKWEIKGL